MPTSSHPTRDRLIATMVELLDGDDPEHITAEQVLNHSGISKGSLYHHFEDFEDLIEAALVFRFSRTVDQSITALTEMITHVSSKEELLEALKVFNRDSQDPARRPFRLERARAAGMTYSSHRFHVSLGEEQQRLTEAFTDLFTEVKNRGWSRPGVDPMAAAVFVQAYTIGRLIDDISPEKMSPENWNSIIDMVIENVLLAD